MLVQLFLALAYVAFAFGFLWAVLIVAASSGGDPGMVILAAISAAAAWAFVGAVLLALSHILRLLLVLEGRTKQLVR